MKILHVPYCFFPDAAGGTEVYVEGLARHQQASGVQVVIAAPGKAGGHYFHKNLMVYRFTVSDRSADLSEIYGGGIAGTAEAFDEILAKEKPDLVHFHAFTPGVSTGALETTRGRKIATVFTYHTPAVSCQRGTLLRWGHEVCDGRLDIHLCTACTLQGLGVNRGVSTLLGRMPPAWGRAIGKAGFRGSPWTALRMTSLLEQRFRAFHRFLDQVDHIVAPCEWAKAVLARNSVPPEKISVSRQGLNSIPHPAPSPLKAEGRGEGGSQVLKAAYFGRLEPSKGVAVLIKAITTSPDLAVHLDIYGISQDGEKSPFVRGLKQSAATDFRITFKPPIGNDTVVSVLREYDLLAVPSQCLETGPLVIQEAFAAGVPVLGSHLGGIAELVQSDVNGLLVEATSVDAWSRALSRIADHRDQLLQWVQKLPKPREMAEVASDMDAIYNGLLCLR